MNAQRDGTIEEHIRLFRMQNRNASNIKHDMNFKKEIGSTNSFVILMTVFFDTSYVISNSTQLQLSCDH